MAEVATKIPGVVVSIPPNLPPRRAVQVMYDLASNPSVDVGDSVEIDGELWIVESLWVDAEQQQAVANLMQPISPAFDISIRTSVKAHRKAVSMMRDLLADKFPGLDFSDAFVFNVISLTARMGHVAAARLISEKLNEYGMPDEELNKLAEKASADLTKQIKETFLLWPGVPEGSPVFSRTDE